MIYGITGNTQKEQLWEPVSELIRWMARQGLEVRLHPDVARGLVARGLLSEDEAAALTAHDLAAEVDLLLSFGGDGTLLQSAHLPVAGVPPCWASTLAVWAFWPMWKWNRCARRSARSKRAITTSKPAWCSRPNWKTGPCRSCPGP
ncbi:hypothetical protein [Rhodothermus marinus]|uniref:hypothetical protein n=1 Tax=Rhodothermus marinus TaxID=29549 RepID=UPI000A97208C|nr:hypothetical protein [Rhodothermus marinus]